MSHLSSPTPEWRPLALSCLFAAMAGGLAVMLRPDTATTAAPLLILTPALALAAGVLIHELFSRPPFLSLLLRLGLLFGVALIAQEAMARFSGGALGSPHRRIH